MKSLLLVLATLFWLSAASPVTGRPTKTSPNPPGTSPESSLNLIRRLDNILVEWFKSLQKVSDKLAASEDQRDLRLSLVSLNKSLYDLESNTRFLVSALDRSPLIEDEVRRGVKDTRAALRVVAKQLHEVGLLLRSQYRAGGAYAEHVLGDAVGAKSKWLNEIEVALNEHRIPRSLINDGNDILQMKREASIRLIQVVEKLQ